MIKDVYKNKGILFCTINDQYFYRLSRNDDWNINNWDRGWCHSSDCNNCDKSIVCTEIKFGKVEKCNKCRYRYVCIFL